MRLRQRCRQCNASNGDLLAVSSTVYARVLGAGRPRRQFCCALRILSSRSITGFRMLQGIIIVLGKLTFGDSRYCEFLGEDDSCCETKRTNRRLLLLLKSDIPDTKSSLRVAGRLSEQSEIIRDAFLEQRRCRDCRVVDWPRFLLASIRQNWVE